MEYKLDGARGLDTNAGRECRTVRQARARRPQQKQRWILNFSSSAIFLQFKLGIRNLIRRKTNYSKPIDV